LVVRYIFAQNHFYIGTIIYRDLLNDEVHSTPTVQQSSYQHNFPFYLFNAKDGVISVIRLFIYLFNYFLFFYQLLPTYQFKIVIFLFFKIEIIKLCFIII